MLNHYEIILEDKIYIQRTPHSKFTEFSLDGAKQNTYDELPSKIKKIVEYNNLISENPSDFLEYRIENDGVIIDKVCTCDCSYLRIPSHIEGYPVTKLGKRIISYDGLNIEQLQLPYTLEKLNTNTFQSATIKYVNIPPKITEIPQRCFYDSDIKAIDLSNISIINKNAFSHCKKLKKIDISNVKFIEEGAFSHCERITSVILPETLTSIPDFIFFQCTNLEEVNFSSGIIDIGKFAFCETAISQLNFPDTLKRIGNYAFEKCEKLTKFIAPPNLIKIGNNAFGQCKNLNKAILNNGLKSIKALAFEKTSLEEILIPRFTDYYSDAFPTTTKIYKENIINKEKFKERGEER